MTFASNSVQVTADVPVVLQSIGGVQANYVKPSFTPESWSQVFLNGQSFPYSLADVDQDGLEEAVVWSNEGAAQISYYLNGELYTEGVTVTSFVSGGQPNNYAVLTQIPALNIVFPPKGYSIEGDAREIVRVGSEVEQVTVVYNTDTTERGALLRTVATLKSQNTGKQQSIEELRTQLAGTSSYAVAWKNAVLYSGYYDSLVSIPQEKEACYQESLTFGSWHPEPGMFPTMVYSGGQGAKYSTQLSTEITSNRYLINTLTHKFLNADILAQNVTATASSSGSTGTASAPLVVDGAANTETAATGINPAQFILDLGESKYITKVLIKGSVGYKVQNLQGLYVSDSPYGTDVSLLPETVGLGNEFTAFSARQLFMDASNIPIKDENGKNFYYLPKKRYIRLNLSSVLEESPSLCEVSVYVADPTETVDLPFYDKTLARYRTNWDQQYAAFGPDNGSVFQFQDNGRSHWATQRALITSNRAPSGSFNSREQDLDQYMTSNNFIVSNQAAAAQSFGTQALKGQRLLMLEAWEKEYTGMIQKYQDMNQLAVDIAKNLNSIELNRAQFVL